jgi:hypothetical protein
MTRASVSGASWRWPGGVLAGSDCPNALVIVTSMIIRKTRVRCMTQANAVDPLRDYFTSADR